jgi:hypothetical protein
VIFPVLVEKNAVFYPFFSKVVMQIPLDIPVTERFMVVLNDIASKAGI